MGSGDAPPKTADDYAPELPAGITMETLKGDPLFTGFLKGAHSKGMTNAQVSYVLDAFAARQQMQASPEAAEAELRKDWTSDQQMTQGLQLSHRAFAAYAGSEDEAKRLDQKFGNDPDFIRFTARIGKELGEDRPPSMAMSPAEALNLEAIYKHAGYFDAKHPEHAKLVAQAKALNEKRTGGR
jgi:hypothetical protein